MRLNRLDLTRYGHFTDRSLTFAPPQPGGSDLHIVYGPNEAGKSTLFSAWLDLLFGIPLRTKYDFRHTGPTMQIGAALSHAGGGLEIKRLKRNQGSLLDRHDQPLPEASLQALLGGLSREGYMAMFSLDDETLEEGGDSILASRGDLGEMLFSASAGLAGLGPQLEGLRAGLDGFHRTGKRSGWLYDAKKRLADLDRRRKELEVTVTALQRLTRDAQAAEQAWTEARSREGVALDKVEALQGLVGTLPLLTQVAGLEARLIPLAGLPDVTAQQQARHQELERERAILEARLRDRLSRIAGLLEETANLPQGGLSLALAPKVQAVELLRAEHDSALKDLPRRRDELGAASDRLRLLLAQLGEKDASAADLAVPQAVLAGLRALLASRSGVQAAVDAAAAEGQKARDALERERVRLGDLGREGDESVLSALLARLRSQDPLERVQRARRHHAEAEARGLQALAALAPWSGSPEALAALDPPTAADLSAWAEAETAAREARVDAERDVLALREELSHLAESAETATAASVTDAAALRVRREGAWAAHRAALSPQTADAFEQALREDDAVWALMAEALAEARRAAVADAARARVALRLSEAERRLAEAEDHERDAQAVISVHAQRLGFGAVTVAGLRDWLASRQLALQSLAETAEKARDLALLEEELAEASRTLALALGAEDAPWEMLLAQGVARVDASERRQEARQRLETLAHDIVTRDAAEAAAQARFANWQAEWHKAVAGTILAAIPDQDAGLGLRLDLLDQLGTEERAAFLLADRISKMEANVARFAEAKSALLGQIGLADDTPWSEVLQRLRRAEDAARDAEGIEHKLINEQRHEQAETRRLAEIEAEFAALGAQLGWVAGQDDLGQHIARCRDATEIRQTLTTLAAELRDRPQPDEGQDLGELRNELSQLRAELQVLRSDTEARLATHLEARRALEAVGGDDALARVVAERETLLLEIRDRAETHMANRFGLIALEAGLRRFRDQHRSAMLNRASQAFSALSRGAYSGLAAQPDGSQEVLVALSAAGGAKLAADLSKGTRFQLYLALRIAGYHEMAQNRATVPFVADDIMETFDDARSAAAFGLLAEMSKAGQVIYLTHHEHLCEIARSVCPEVQITRLIPA